MPTEVPLVSADPRADALVLSVRTALVNSENSEALQQALEEALEQHGVSPVAVNLADVETLTSAGLGVLIYLHTNLQRANRRFAVCGATGGVADTLRVARLDRLIEVCPSVNDFLLRLRGKHR